MNKEKCERILECLSSSEQLEVLLSYGYNLTLAARTIYYESQSLKVADLKLLNDINEINHRLFPQIKSLIIKSEPAFSISVMTALISGKDNSEIKIISLRAFENALPLHLLKIFT